MLVRLAQAIGRIVLAGRDMSRLAGWVACSFVTSSDDVIWCRFTARVNELMDVTDELNQGVYKRTMVSKQKVDSDEDDLVPGAGNVIHDSVIRWQIIVQWQLFILSCDRFEDVPLVTPNGDVLIKKLNFEVKPGNNVIICGPNGCGKSSLFRILGEVEIMSSWSSFSTSSCFQLWPLFGGTLVKPDQGKLFYVPQRPYMTLGTLRDQIIYPDTLKDMQMKGYKDEDLNDYLDQVQMTEILRSNGGWDAVEDWMDVLSGGEKQRVAVSLSHLLFIFY